MPTSIIIGAVIGLAVPCIATYTMHKHDIHMALRSFWMMILTLTGLGTYGGLLIYASQDSNRLLQNWVAGLFVVAGLWAMVGGVSWAAYETPDECMLIFRWCRLFGRRSAEFPKSLEQREALREWARMTLEFAARTASGAFARRDELRDILRAYTKKILEPAADPTELLNVWQMHENDVERARQLAASAESAAQADYDLYLKRWDLFKAMGILPFHPTQGDAWKDPNAFRESLEKPENPFVPPTSKSMQRNCSMVGI